MTHIYQTLYIEYTCVLCTHYIPIFFAQACLKPQSINQGLLHLCTFSMLTGQWLMVEEFLKLERKLRYCIHARILVGDYVFLNIIDFRNFYINIAISFKAHSSTACKRSIL